MKFQQLKKKKFRGFSTHFLVFRELVRVFRKYKKWERHIYMNLFNFSKNAVISEHLTCIKILPSVQKYLSNTFQ